MMSGPRARRSSDRTSLPLEGEASTVAEATAVGVVLIAAVAATVFKLVNGKD